MAHQLEIGVVHEVADIAPAARIIIVDAQHIMALRDQPVT